MKFQIPPYDLEALEVNVNLEVVEDDNGIPVVDIDRCHVTVTGHIDVSEQDEDDDIIPYLKINLEELDAGQRETIAEALVDLSNKIRVTH